MKPTSISNNDLSSEVINTNSLETNKLSTVERDAKLAAERAKKATAEAARKAEAETKRKNASKTEAENKIFTLKIAIGNRDIRINELKNKLNNYNVADIAAEEVKLNEKLVAFEDNFKALSDKKNASIESTQKQIEKLNASLANKINEMSEWTNKKLTERSKIQNNIVSELDKIVKNNAKIIEQKGRTINEIKRLDTLQSDATIKIKELTNII